MSTLTNSNQHDNGTSISNDFVKIILEPYNGYYSKKYLVLYNNNWVELVNGGIDAKSSLILNEGLKEINLYYTEISSSIISEDSSTIILKGVFDEISFSEIITINNNSKFIHSEIRLFINKKKSISKIYSIFNFSPEGKKYLDYKPLDFIFTPNLRPDKEHVIADHVFRSPAIILQKGKFATALIPDIKILNNNRKMKTAMDLQVEKASNPSFSYGFTNWDVDGHVFYKHNDNMISEFQNEELVFGFYLYLDCGVRPKEAHKEVVRFMYNNFFKSSSDKNTGALNKPIEQWGKDCWYKYANDVWMDVNINGEDCGAMRNFRLSWSNNLHESANNDAWFNVWFQNLKTAYGMYIYGKQKVDSSLMEKGIKVLKLALNAPQKDGIFPSIYYNSNGHHWVGDHNWGGIGPNFYSTFHDSFQCYTMLKWYEIIGDKILKERIINFCKKYADFLLNHQLDSGVIPSWYDMETLLPSPIMEKENAETSASALFLLEFYRLTKNKHYLDCALKSIDYLRKNIIPDNKWFDYETFFSCSRKPIDFFDDYTKQYPQNTLSLYMTIEAFKTLYLINNDKEVLKEALRLLDYLLLYQQVWSPKFLSRQLLGGFGVQNTDGEWSDARQAYFSITLLDFFEITGEREYFERAIEAARATFGCFEENSPRCYENYAHSGYDKVTGVTGISWGTGSAMTAISIIQEKYGDVFIDVEEKWGKALNYLWVENLEINGQKINLELKQPSQFIQEIIIFFGNYQTNQSYELSINNEKLGDFDFSKNNRVKFILR